ECMEHDIGAARGSGDGVMIERGELDDLGAGRRARGAAGPHQARDRPTGGTERLRRLVAEPPGRAEYEDARGHDFRSRSFARSTTYIRRPRIESGAMVSPSWRC